MPLGSQLASDAPQLTPEIFWAITAVVVGVIAILVGAWAAFRSARPRRALYITMDQPVPLDQEPFLRKLLGPDGDGIATRIPDLEKAYPIVARVHIDSHSSLDITPSHFCGSPLELRFHVPVLALTGKQVLARRRSAVREPRVEVSDKSLLIHPALLTRRHRLTYTVLLDGEPIFEPVGEMPDVDIYEKRVPKAAPLSLQLVTGALLIAGVALAAINGSQPEPNPVISFAQIAVAVIVIPSAAVMLWLSIRYR